MVLICEHCSKEYKSQAWFVKHKIKCSRPGAVEPACEDDPTANIDLNQAFCFDESLFDDSMHIIVNDQSFFHDWSARLGTLFDATDSNSIIRVLHLNINSVSSKLDEIEALCASNHFDFIFLQESKIDQSTPDSAIAFANYNVHRRDRTSRGGGILCYFKKTYKITNINSSASFESVHYRLQINGKMLNLITAYRPPCFDEETFLKCLDTQLSTLDMSECCIVSGDFNFDLLSARGNRLRHFANCANLHLVDATKATRLISSTLLDVFLTNQPSSIIKHYVEPCPFSDHSAVICDLAFKRHKDTSNTVVLRRLTDESLALIDNEIKKCSFGFLDNIANVNDRWIMLK